MAKLFSEEALGTNSLGRQKSNGPQVALKSPVYFIYPKDLVLFLGCESFAQCIYVYDVNSWSRQRSEEAVGSLETGVTDSS